MAGSTPPAQKAQASLTHTQIYPHTKVMMVNYMPGGWNSPAKDPAVQEFMATHYDAIDGGMPELANFTPAGNTPPVQMFYNNYYCMYVGNSEYLDAQTWATAHSVNFEDFFIHYSEPTRACFGSVCYDLPAGSRVPTYDWYSSGGDLTKDSARVVMNPGNPNYRAWKLDQAERTFANSPNLDGVFIDNVYLVGVGVKTPAVASGGTYQEYTGASAGTNYGNDLIILMKEFKEKFGTSKVQVPNVAQYEDSQSRIDQTYNCSDPACPYIWGIYREFTIQPDRAFWVPLDSIYNSGLKGLQNFIEGVNRAERYDIPYLAEYYLLKTETTYVWPMKNWVLDSYGIDPRLNQWIPAVAYNIGQPKNDPLGATKYKTYFKGIDPSSINKDTMNVTSAVKTGWSYRLTDPTKNWTAEQWTGKAIVFPDGFSMSVFHSGTNWIDLYDPSKIPTNGEYKLGDRTYTVFGRDFDNALVLFKPLPSYSVTETGDPSATVEQLPVTSDNPTGRYFILQADGALNSTPITTISLRNTDGAILIKESALGRPNISKRVDKSSAQSGDTLTYTISYSNPTANTYTNAKIEDPIPNGTTYVTGSATNGGTFDGSKIILNIGNLAAGAAGNIQFQVKIL